MVKNQRFETVVYVGILPGSPSEALLQQEVKPWPGAGGSVKLTDVLEGCVVEKAAVHVLDTVVGPSDLDVGDAVDPDGFVANASLSADTLGAGAYIAGPGKRYSAEAAVSLAVNGPAATAGLLAVVLTGYRI